MKKVTIFSNYEVKMITKKEATEFIVKYHYSHTFPAACVSLGAFFEDELIGAIVFGMSAQPKLASSIVPYLKQQDYYELQRLFVKDCTLPNFESWFISKSIDWIKVNRPYIKVLVSFSDPHFLHQGTVYQASNWLFVGKTAKSKAHVDANGIQVHPRTIAKGKIDISDLTEEERPPKNRYIMFLVKGIDVYINILDNSVIRVEDVQYWLNKEKEDGKLYIERSNGYLKKHKANLKNDLKRDILKYPKL